MGHHEVVPGNTESNVIDDRVDVSVHRADDEPVADSPEKTPRSTKLSVPRRITRADWLSIAVIIVLGWYIRFSALRSSGGVRAVLGYDDSVYFSSAIYWTHGLSPYRDYLLVHPPGSTVVYAPFALLARFIGEANGYAVGRLSVVALSGLTIFLVWLAGRRISRGAGLAAALFYATWMSVVRVERSTLLEPFVQLSVAACAALLTSPRISRRVSSGEGRWTWLWPTVAGLSVGLGVSCKLWAAIPAGIFLVWMLFWAKLRYTVMFAAASVGGFLLISAPFIIRAPSDFFRLVLQLQLSRSDTGRDLPDRLLQVFNLGPDIEPKFAYLLLGLTVLVGVLASWRWAVARVYFAVFLINTAVVLSVPVFFNGYCSFMSVALALLVGAVGGFAEWLWQRNRQQWGIPLSRVAAGLVGAGIVGVAYWTGQYSASEPQGFGRVPAGVQASVANATCIATDRPSVLILMNRVATNLKNNCPRVVDPTGLKYDTPAYRDELSKKQQVEASGEVEGEYLADSDAIIYLRRPIGPIAAKIAQLDQRELQVFRNGQGGKARVWGPVRPTPTP